MTIILELMYGQHNVYLAVMMKMIANAYVNTPHGQSLIVIAQVAVIVIVIFNLFPHKIS
jgi:hypothetical protein